MNLYFVISLTYTIVTQYNLSIKIHIMLMQKIIQAKNLSHKAETYINQGNYQYALSCYEQIIAILRQSLAQVNSKETVQQIKGKIERYNHLKAEAEKKIRQKQQLGFKKSALFGFPVISPNRSSNKLIGQVKNSVEKNNHNDLHTKQQHLIIRKQQQPKKQVDSLDKIDKKKLIKKQVILIQKKPEIPLKKPDMHNIKKTDHKNLVPKINKPDKKIVIDPEIEELIIKNLDVSFSDIAGLEEAKSILEQAVIRPRKRPDLYVGIRAPPKGLLLYGPPGNGKTFICKALAKESGCTFFALSASSVLNKYVGQSQKTIKKIFDAALKCAPSIIFIDQIDSMLTARSEKQNQASRRLKTQFLVLMDGINSPKGGQVLVIGATNLPKQLDNAAKRRFSKFIYIGNPDYEARKQLLLKNLKMVQYDLSSADLDKIVNFLEYYSASQIKNIISEACMIPLRQITESKFLQISNAEIRKLNLKDFTMVVNQRKPIVSKQQLEKYKQQI